MRNGEGPPQTRPVAIPMLLQSPDETRAMQRHLAIPATYSMLISFITLLLQPLDIYWHVYVGFQRGRSQLIDFYCILTLAHHIHRAMTLHSVLYIG